MRVALVAIAKNEEPYIKEWVEYYVKLNFDHIYIYQNDWRTDYEHPSLTKFILDGKDKQREAYNNFLHHHKHGFDFAAFFDLDEFLVLKKHKTIQEFVSDYKNYIGIGINWYMFGNNGHTEVIDNQYSQLKRFTKRSTHMDTHVKTIVNLHMCNETDVHCPIYSQIISPNFVKFKGPHNHNTNDEIAQLNHYYCKTPEEFIKKCQRGRADTSYTKNTYPTNYNPYNLNDVEDTSALKFMYED